MNNSVLAAIYNRRSIRDYTDEAVSKEDLYEIIRAGVWAPSGLNNQPWRFVVIRDKEVSGQLAEQTHYGQIVRSAAALIAVYLDETVMYDPVKDHQAAGACIQNMLLATEALGLGAVWLGQILKNKKQVNAILELGDHLDLMAVLAIGYPAHRDQKSTRKELAEFLLREY